MSSSLAVVAEARLTQRDRDIFAGSNPVHGNHFVGSILFFKAFHVTSQKKL